MTMSNSRKTSHLVLKLAMKDFATEVYRNFLDNCLELRDCSGLLPEDLGICVPPEVVVINPGCKGATDSSP